MKVGDNVMADKKNTKQSNTKQVNTTKKLTKIFVWIMLFSMLGSGFISVILTLIGS